jgi:zinc transport system ATP-binding protein
LHLSGGQQQRVYIARALVRNPSVLVLDEPLAGVDAASQQQLADVLANLIAKGITVVVILHELGALAPLITRAIVLREGRVIADAAPDNLAALDTAELHHGHTHESQEDSISKLVTQLSEHETGFPGLSGQISALTTHHPHHIPEPGNGDYHV